MRPAEPTGKEYMEPGGEAPADLLDLLATDLNRYFQLLVLNSQQRLYVFALPVGQPTGCGGYRAGGVHSRIPCAGGLSRRAHTRDEAPALAVQNHAARLLSP